MMRLLVSRRGEKIVSSSCLFGWNELQTQRYCVASSFRQLSTGATCRSLAKYSTSKNSSKLGRALYQQIKNGSTESVTTRSKQPAGRANTKLEEPNDWVKISVFGLLLAGSGFVMGMNLRPFFKSIGDKALEIKDTVFKTLVVDRTLPAVGLSPVQADITDTVYFDFEADGQHLGRVIIGLYGSEVPGTVGSFLKLVRTPETSKADPTTPSEQPKDISAQNKGGVSGWFRRKPAAEAAASSSGGGRRTGSGDASASYSYRGTYVRKITPQNIFSLQATSITNGASSASTGSSGSSSSKIALPLGASSGSEEDEVGSSRLRHLGIGVVTARRFAATSAAAASGGDTTAKTAPTDEARGSKADKMGYGQFGIVLNPRPSVELDRAVLPQRRPRKEPPKGSPKEAPKEGEPGVGGSGGDSGRGGGGKERKKYVVFGQVMKGLDTLTAVEGLGQKNGQPMKKVTVSNCGVLPNDS